MTTMQAVLDLARQPLNDPGKVSYPDAVLLPYLNTAIREVLRLRPDYRVGSSLAWGSYTDRLVGDTFPLPDDLMQAAADYVSGRAEMGDDEHVNSARAQQLLTLFVSEL